MTVASDTPSFIQIPGNGTATSFAFPFKIFQASDLVVGFITSSGYTQQTSGFTVQNVDVNGGGNVGFTTAPPSGTTVDIRSVTPKIQNTEFANLGAFLPEAHTEAFDRLTRTVQDLYRLAYTFGIHGPDQEGTAWTALPVASQRKNNALMFDSNGLPTVGTLVSQALTQSLIGQFLYPQTAAEIAAGVTPTNYAYLGRPLIDPFRYGMKADGSTDDHVAYQDALNVAAQKGGYVQLPAGSIVLGGAITHPANVLVRGCGSQNTKLLRGFAGNLVTSFGSYASLQDLTIDGQEGTYGNGIGILVASGTNQSWYNCEITGFNQQCVQFAANAGSNSIMVGGACFTTGAVGSVGAIQVNGTDSAATPRVFLGVESGGCTLFDFGGCNDLFVCGGYSNGLIFGAASSKIYITNFRVGAATGAAFAINGSAHTIQNVVSAVTSITIAGSNHIISILPSGGGWGSITDNSTGSAVFIKQVSYTPTWTNSGTAPSLGNGTLAGQWSRNGNTVAVDIDFQTGSTTTFGTGDFRFSLPFAPYSFGQFVVGSATLIDADGTPEVWGAGVQVNPALSYITLAPFNSTTAGSVGAANPFAWANGDRVTLHVEYQVP